MLNQTFVGIDPGLDGAIAILHYKHNRGVIVLDKHTSDVHDTPITKEKKNGSLIRDYKIPDLFNIVDGIRAMFGSDSAFVGLERVASMPGQGVHSMFKMGEGLGIWRGVLGACGLEYEWVHSLKWRRHYGFIKHVKDMTQEQKKVYHNNRKRVSLEHARKLFGDDVDLSLQKHSGRADALLIAKFLQDREMGA